MFVGRCSLELSNHKLQSQLKKSQAYASRSNLLFIGNARGGRTQAMLVSLTSTCRRHHVDPQLYLMELLINLPRLANERTPGRAAG
jgi:hypothetical protein